MVILRSADPEPSGVPDPEPPESPRTQKRGGQKTPREIDLEKKLCKVEDRMDSLESSVGGISEWLEKLFPGGRKAPPPAPAPDAKPKSFWDEILDL